MHYTLKLRIVFWQLMLFIPISGWTQKDSLNKQLLQLEEQIFGLSDSMIYTHDNLILKKIKIYSSCGEYQKVLSESKRLVSDLSGQEKCELDKMRYDASIRIDKSNEVLAELNKTSICDHDTQLILLRAIIWLENEKFEEFSNEIARINLNESNYFNKLILSGNENAIQNKRKWLPAWHLSNRNYLKASTTLMLHSSPAIVLTAGIIFSIPVTGVLLGSYLGWRIYGSNRISIMQAIQKKNWQESTKKVLAGYEIVGRLAQSY